MNSILSFDWWQAESIVIPFMTLVVCPAIVLTIVALMRKHKIDKKTEVMIAAIQNGVDLDPDFFGGKGKASIGKKTPAEKQKEKFQEGVTTAILGLVLIVVGFCVMHRINLLSLLFFIPGGVLFANGMGLIANFLVSRKDGAKPGEKPEEQ